MSSDQAAVARISRYVGVSPDRVYDAWLNPDLLGRWMFGPEVREEKILHLNCSPVVGGAFSFLVRRGETEFDHVGEYLELDPPGRLAFTWGLRQEGATDFSVVRVEIVPDGSGCEVRVTHEMHPDWAAYAERAAAGWSQMLDALARLLE